MLIQEKHDLSLSDFMKSLVSLMDERRWKLPLKNEKPWHVLFYELKKANLGARKPKFLNELRFDWDGPYPKSQDVSDFLHALHWNASVSAANPQFTTISLSPEVAELWKKLHSELDSEARSMVDNAMPYAEKQFA